MTHVSLTGVSKVYPPAYLALAGVSLDISQGEVLALTGPSGSGKTTILRLLAGLESSTSGEVLLDGRRADHLPPHQRGVSLLSQRPVLYPHLSVRGNLRFGLPRSAPDSTLDIADILGLTSLLSRKPGELSGGQQQRVALGRALARRSRLLLLDEPFASLDGPLREELRPQLHLLQRHLAATMIIVTHEQDEAIGLADRIAVLEAGRLVQLGTPREVAGHPATPFAAWLFRARPAIPFDATTGLGPTDAPTGGALPPERSGLPPTV